MKSGLPKKSLIVLLTFFYSICAVGLDVKVHYCHGKISSVSVGFKEEKCCCEKKRAAKCCTSKEVSFKIDTKQIKTAESKSSPKNIVAAVPFKTTSAFLTKIESVSGRIFSFFYRALFKAVPRFILNSVFRI